MKPAPANKNIALPMAMPTMAPVLRLLDEPDGPGVPEVSAALDPLVVGNKLVVELAETFAWAGHFVKELFPAALLVVSRVSLT
jgi:hypothetical protein